MVRRATIGFLLGDQRITIAAASIARSARRRLWAAGAREPAEGAWYDCAIVYEGGNDVGRIIHARRDGQTERLLREIERRLGWNDSQAVREGIKALNVLLVPRRSRQIAGLGRFRS